MVVVFFCNRTNVPMADERLMSVKKVCFLNKKEVWSKGGDEINEIRGAREERVGIVCSENVTGSSTW